MIDRTPPEWAMVSVMFVDIRGFTSFADRSAVRQAVDLLNEFFELAIPRAHPPRRARDQAAR